MLKSKFIEILRTFTSDELKDFRNFLRSPYHNSNKNVIKVADMLKQFYPDFSSEKLSKENMFRKLYPGKKYNDTVMRILLSDLIKLAEEFLSLSNFRRDPLNEKKFLLAELDRRNLNALFNRHQKAIRDMLSENSLIDVNYFRDLFEVESLIVNNLISTGRQSESANEVLMQGEHIINFFLSNILNIAHELETQHEVLNINFDFNPVKEFLKNFNVEKYLDSLSQNNYKYSDILRIYYLMYLSCRQRVIDEIYFELKQLIGNNLHFFKREEKFNLFIILESLCLSKISQGKSEFFGHLMQIYEEMLLRKIYTHSESESFQLNLFRNMFYTANTLKRFDWVEKFLNEHLNELLPEYRENTRHLALAYLNFEKKDFEKALDEITQVKYNYFAFKFDVRLLTLKIYYELDSFEPALSLIDTFSHFLSNNESAANYRASFGEFLKILKSLIRIKTGSTKKSVEVLIGDIENSERIYGRKWLLEKVKLLK